MIDKGKREEAIKAAKERQTKLQGILNALQSQAVNLSDKLLTAKNARLSPMQR